jgi:hypothetical protein
MDALSFNLCFRHHKLGTLRCRLGRAASTPSRLLFGVDREAYKLVLNACREAKAAEPQDVEVA